MIALCVLYTTDPFPPPFLPPMRIQQICLLLAILIALLAVAAVYVYDVYVFTRVLSGSATHSEVVYTIFSMMLD